MIKVTRKSLARFKYFAQCEDTKRLPAIPFSPEGHSAALCFHAHETFGQSLPCREPDLLARALNGKEHHGITVTNCAQDFIDRLLFSCEIETQYPDWVQRDILGRASQLSMIQLGFVPTFVRTGKDFTTTKEDGK